MLDTSHELRQTALRYHLTVSAYVPPSAHSICIIASAFSWPRNAGYVPPAARPPAGIQADNGTRRHFRTSSCAHPARSARYSSFTTDYAPPRRVKLGRAADQHADLTYREKKGTDDATTTTLVAAGVNSLPHAQPTHAPWHKLRTRIAIAPCRIRIAIAPWHTPRIRIAIALRTRVRILIC